MALAAGCAPAAGPLPPPDAALPAAPTTPVYLVQLGWHTRIAVRQADVPAEAWPESRAFGPAEVIEVGWGDRAFYQADDPTVGMALRAALGPSPAVLHVAALRAPICEARAGLPIVRVDVSPEGVHRLARFLRDSYVRDEQGRPMSTRPGQEPGSAFYLATGGYHAFNTSNTWTARALQAAGVPVTPRLTVFSGTVMAQALEAGRPACGAEPGRQ